MKTAMLLPPSTDLVETIVDHITAGSSTKDLSDVLVVFPGKRPGHVLRKRLAARIGTAFIPPKIFSIDLFIDFIVRDLLHHSGSDLSPLDAAAILQELHERIPKEERISEKHFTTFDAFYPLATLLFKELEELHITGIAPLRLREEIASVSLPAASTLGSLYQTFYSELAARGWVTRSMKYRIAAEGIREADLSSYRDIILAGFYAYTVPEADIVRHLKTLPSTSMFFQDGPGINAHLASIGLELSAEPEQHTVTDHFSEAPDAHGELFALNAALPSGEAALSDDTVIVMPAAENLFPLYHQTLAGYDRSEYNIALGYPLTRTPAFGFLSSLLNVLVTSRNREVHVPEYLAFLLHPYTKNILYEGRSDVTRFLVHAVEEECLRHRTKVFVTLEAMEQSVEIQKKVEQRAATEGLVLEKEAIQQHLIDIHAATVKKMVEVKTIGELGTACVEVLQYIGTSSTAHRHAFFRPFVEALMEHLQALPVSLLAARRFDTNEQMEAFLTRYIGEAEVPFTGTPLKGLQVLGFLETRGVRFKHVYFLDCNDDVIPGGTPQDVLLPLSVRKRLGLSTYKDQEQIKAYLFDVLRNGADDAHYFFIENDTKSKSRFIEQLIWRQQSAVGSLSAGSVRQLQYRVDLGTDRPATIPKDGAMMERIGELKYSTTMLDTYLQCPLRFMYMYVARLREKDEISGDVESSDIGTAVHEILRKYFIPFEGKRYTGADTDLPRLEEVINTHFESVYGRELLGEQLFAKRQIQKHLTDYLTGLSREQADSSSIVIQQLEAKFASTIGEWEFEGRADRIETRNGKPFILDFKTGGKKDRVTIRFDALNMDDRSTWNDAIGSLQLPLYTMLYSRSEQVAVDAITPAIVFLGRQQLDEKVEYSLFTDATEAREWIPKLEKIILALVGEITDPSMPFLPTDDVEHDCPSCPFTYICGTQWNVEYNR